MESERQYIDLFRAGRQLLEANSCAPLNACREKAADLLGKHGLPGPKDERYKYTDVQAAFAPDFGLNLKRVPFSSDPYKAFHCNVTGLSTYLVYVVNDMVCPLRGGMGLPPGVKVLSFREAEREMPGFIGKFYNNAASRHYDGVTALNTLLAQDGLLVYLPEGADLGSPLQIVNVSSAAVDMMSNRRVLVVAGAGAKASLLFCDHADGGRRFLTTQVTEAYLGEGAAVDFYFIEETNTGNARFSNAYMELQRGSRAACNGITLHNGLTCNRVDVRLEGEGAQASMAGVAIADGSEHVDNNVLVEHGALSCTSDMLYKYVLDGQAVGAFAGKVLVREGAQKAASQQTNANLCVSPEARAYSQPMLEIYADDVKCNHGSTVGKLDENALFYMRQRGVEEKEARLLLQHAFVNDVLQRVGVERLRDRLSFLVEQRFRGELSRCKGCKMCK